MTWMHYRRGVVMPLLTILAAGCKPAMDRTGIQGVVSYQGRPIERGQIEMYPIEGTNGPMVGSLIQRGAYQIEANKGPAVGGKYKVRIIGLRKTGAKMKDRDRPQATPDDVYENFIPAEFNSQSALKIAIRPENPNQVNFTLPVESTAH